MRILICGAGIGGLTLAHALQSVAEVIVVDRDSAAAETGGYRLHLDAHACAVLRQHLSASHWARIQASAETSERFTTFTITDHLLRPIVQEKQPASEERLLCDRRTLRAHLCESLDRPVRFGRRVVRVHPGEFPYVEVDDGTVLAADVIIGAEGSRSPTVRALAGSVTAHPTGLCGIAGRAPVAGDDEIPEPLRTGPAIAISARGVGLFLSVTSASPDAKTERAGATPGISTPTASLIWGLITRRSDLPVNLPDTGEELLALACASLPRWEARLRSTLADSDPESVTAYPFYAADPRADLTPWAPGSVTAIGDAVHAMPPTGGQGAATAIRDAGDLADRIFAGPCTLDRVKRAIAVYEAAMPSWAVPAMKESNVSAAIIKTLGLPGMPLLATVPLGIAARFGQLRYGRRR